MAAAPGDDIHQQLATLLIRESVVQIRKTNTTPPQISVVDVDAVITGKGRDLRCAPDSTRARALPGSSRKIIMKRFASRGRETPVGDVYAIVEVVMLTGGCARPV